MPPSLESNSPPFLVCFSSAERRLRPAARGVYEPSLSVFAQGRKRIDLGGTSYLCDGSSFLLTSIDVPVQSQIIEASERTPMLSMLLRLDMPTVRDVLSRDDLPQAETADHPRGMAVGETTAGMLGACMRQIELLDTPEDIPFLSHLLQREIVYRILRTPQADRLRAIATAGDPSHRTAEPLRGSKPTTRSRCTWRSSPLLRGWGNRRCTTNSAR